jgi:torulene dioxygenase
VSKTDASRLIEFDPVTLEPTRFFTYEDINSEFKVTLNVTYNKIQGVPSAAHSQYDHSTGEFFNFTLNFGKTGIYTIFSISDNAPQGPNLPRKFLPPGRVLAKIQEFPAYIHSFALTRKYVILIIWPCAYKPLVNFPTPHP